MNDDASRETDPGSKGPYQLAGWPRRAIASVIDAAVVYLGLLTIAGAVTQAVGTAAGNRADGDAGVGLGLFFVVLLFCGVVLYHPLMESSGWKATLGKRLLRLQVVDSATTARLSFGRALHRRLVYLVLWVPGITGVINCLWPLWDRNSQALHDRAARSIVVEARTFSSSGVPSATATHADVR